jgi:surface protein
MTIATLCNPTQDYVDTDVIIKINIDYDISCVECEGPVTAPYIFEVDVNLAGSTGPGKFVLPLESGGTYDFNVDWGDGNFDTINTWNDPLAEHTYTSISNYTIKITGQLSGWTFNNGGDKEKMVEIKQWGILELGNSGGHFYGCNNLVLTGVTDFLNLTNCNTLFNTFRGCTSLTTINNIEYWDTSTITNMLATFRDTTSFDDNIENWNVENVTTINSMFRGCTLYNQPLNNWNTSSVTDTTRMFIFATSFNQDISNWDMGNNTQIGAMFQGATSFNQPLNSWNVSNVTSSNDMFNGATSFNQTLNNWNVINLISAPGMFNNATSFDQDLSTWNVSALQGGGFMFDGCNMSQTNYENLLIGWNSLPSLQPNVILGVNGLQYQIGSTADVARSNIIASYTWTFVGDIAVP